MPDVDLYQYKVFWLLFQFVKIRSSQYIQVLFKHEGNYDLKFWQIYLPGQKELVSAL